MRRSVLDGDADRPRPLGWRFLERVAEALRRADIHAEPFDREHQLPSHPCEGVQGVAIRAWPLMGREPSDTPSHFFAPPRVRWARTRRQQVTGWEWLGTLYTPSGDFDGLIVLPVQADEEDPNAVVSAIAGAIAADATVPLESRLALPKALTHWRAAEGTVILRSTPAPDS